MRPEVRQWIRKAERDFRTAQTLVPSHSRDLYESTGFHAQQCIEKYVKAFLIHAGIPFYKVHDLTALLNAGASADASLARFARAVAPLNRFAVLFRYPGPQPRKRDVERALKAMSALRGELRTRLGLKP